jgi:hypothetical protein
MIGCLPSHSVRNVWIEEQILEAVERQPTINIKRYASSTGTFHASVLRTLQERQLYLSISH